ncbi:MAG: hypothetical protein JSS09_00410, partial [Verrucomicrobia bacterium]|nr:hypothetical protein [Verrucomicrobiota bacterium]
MDRISQISSGFSSPNSSTPGTPQRGSDDKVQSTALSIFNMPSPIRLFKWGASQFSRFFPMDGFQNINEDNFVTKESFERLKREIELKLNIDSVEFDEEGVFSARSPGLRRGGSIALEHRQKRSPILTEKDIRSIVRDEIRRTEIVRSCENGENVEFNPLHRSATACINASNSNSDLLGPNPTPRSSDSSNQDLASSWISLESSNGKISSSSLRNLEQNSPMGRSHTMSAFNTEPSVGR